jgi:endonuclease YncB( thermonuclease family)
MEILRLLIILSFALTTSFTGTVIKITDGDKLGLTKDKKQIKIRLKSIYCPEVKQVNS